MCLSACGRKQVQVKAPQGPPSISTSSNELEGIASYYAEPYHGRRTANGEVFDTYQHLTAAHRTLPFNTTVRVRNERNGQEVVVRINDRGPFIDGRIIDLSLRAAREIDMVRAGIVPVKLQILELAASPRSGSVYAVQVGAFENARAAEQLRQQLAKKYSGVTVQPVSADKTWYRVRIGSAPDLDSAHRLAAELRKEAFTPFVVRLE